MHFAFTYSVLVKLDRSKFLWLARPRVVMHNSTAYTVNNVVFGFVVI